MSKQGTSKTICDQLRDALVMLRNRRTYNDSGSRRSTILSNPVDDAIEAALTGAMSALSEPPAVGTSAAFRELIAILDAARGIRHWHDWGRNNEGMVVSAEHVRALWGAVAAYEKRKSCSDCAKQPKVNP